ncbi:MAG: flagellar hook-basal body complex protein FliE, partial [Candidatus Kryptoniota bacterium]
MKVGDIQQVWPQLPQDSSLSKNVDESVRSFEDTLNDFVKSVNSLQNQANSAIDDMASGRAADVHEVMIAVEKAKVSFDLLLEIRNKMLDA